MKRSRLAMRAKVCAVMHLATLLFVVPPAAAEPPAPVSDSVLEALGRLPRREGVAALVRALEGGLSDAQTVLALRALGRQGGARAASELRAYTEHRRPEAREAAYEALAESRTAEAVDRLVEGLSDASPRVRERCAVLLRAFPSESARAALRKAMQRGATEAALSLSAIAPASELPGLSEALARFPIDAQLQAYRTAYLREDVATDEKAALIATVMRIGTPPARGLLVELLKTAPSRESKRLREALLTAIRRLASPQDGAP